MKKQDNESLIQELTKRLDWYIMKASDEEFDADEFQGILEEKQIETEIAQNGTDAMELLKQKEYQILVTDLNSCLKFTGLRNTRNTSRLFK